MKAYSSILSVTNQAFTHILKWKESVLCKVKFKLPCLIFCLQSEYDDNQVDPQSKQPPEQQPDALDLPDNLNLDEEEGQETNEDKQAPEQG